MFDNIGFIDERLLHVISDKLSNMANEGSIDSTEEIVFTDDASLQKGGSSIPLYATRGSRVPHLPTGNDVSSSAILNEYLANRRADNYSPPPSDDDVKNMSREVYKSNMISSLFILVGADEISSHQIPRKYVKSDVNLPADIDTKILDKIRRNDNKYSRNSQGAAQSYDKK